MHALAFSVLLVTVNMSCWLLLSREPFACQERPRGRAGWPQAVPCRAWLLHLANVRLPVNICQVNEQHLCPWFFCLFLLLGFLDRFPGKACGGELRIIN